MKQKFFEKILDLLFYTTLIGFLGTVTLYIISVNSETKYLSEASFLKLIELFYTGGILRFAGFILPDVVKMVVEKISKKAE